MDGTVTAKEYKAWGWTYGGNLKMSFPETGVVIEPCAIVAHQIAGGESAADISTTTIPGTFCVEVDTGRLEE